MPVSYAEVLQLLSELCEESEVGKTAKGAATGTGIVAASTLVLGILGGPIGLAVGGALGGMAAGVVMKGKYQPLAAALRSLPEERRRELGRRALAILQGVDTTDILRLTAVVRADRKITESLLEAVSRQVEEHMRDTREVAKAKG